MAKVKITTTYENGTVTHDMAATNKRTLTEAMVILRVLNAQSPSDSAVRKFTAEAGLPFESLLRLLSIPLPGDEEPATEEADEQPATT